MSAKARYNRPGIRKKLAILLALIAGILAFQYAAAQSGSSQINLNSPVSFPVDI